MITIRKKLRNTISKKVIRDINEEEWQCLTQNLKERIWQYDRGNKTQYRVFTLFQTPFLLLALQP